MADPDFNAHPSSGCAAFMSGAASGLGKGLADVVLTGVAGAAAGATYGYFTAQTNAGDPPLKRFGETLAPMLAWGLMMLIVATSVLTTVYMLKAMFTLFRRNVILGVLIVGPLAWLGYGVAKFLAGCPVEIPKDQVTIVAVGILIYVPSLIVAFMWTVTVRFLWRLAANRLS